MSRKSTIRVKSRRQEARAMQQRAANELAQRAGRPLPYPNPWDSLDPTKVRRDATPEEIEARYVAFCELCPPPTRIEYTI